MEINGESGMPDEYSLTMSASFLHAHVVVKVSYNLNIPEAGPTALKFKEPLHKRWVICYN